MVDIKKEKVAGWILIILGINVFLPFVGKLGIISTGIGIAALVTAFMLLWR